MTSRPRKGSTVSFTHDDGLVEAQNPSSVTGLRFNVEARSGGTASLDFSDLQPRPLAISGAQAIRRLSEVGGPLGARSTIKAYANTLRIFFAYLASEAPKLRMSQQLEARHIDGFEEWLDTQGKSRIHAFTILSKIVVVLREIEADDPNAVAPGLRDRLRYTSARPFERSHPRDAYSPYVARQLRDAARTDVAAMMRRIDGGLKQTLRDHPDPFIRQQAHALHEAVGRLGYLPYNDKTITALYRALYKSGATTVRLLNDIYSRFYLTVHDLPPLLTLLSLGTGLEIECVKSLKVDCLSSAGGGTVNLSYTKRRAHGLAQKTMRVRDGGPTTPGGLIRAIVKMTETARRFHPTDALFLFYHAREFYAVVRHPKSTLKCWIERHGIVDDTGRPLKLVLSRLRKTYKMLWYRKTDGHMARFAVGHTVEIASRHYADIPSLRPLHEATIAEALQDAITLSADRENTSGPAHRDTLSYTPPTLRPEDHSVSEPKGAQEVWLAHCSGFYDSPFSKTGAPCGHPFWGCLDCRNAIITEHKLPAILGFLEFILDQRAALSGDDWTAKFGHVHQRITKQVLPSFSAEVIAAARSALTTDPPLTYLPPETSQ